MILNVYIKIMLRLKLWMLIELCFVLFCLAGVSEQHCHFPFTYHGKKYYKCTDLNEDYPWCALTKDFDSDHWAYCIGGS